MAQTQEINIPVADPNDPYANPAAMPSSADRSPRSFEVDAFEVPDLKQDDWRYTPVERVEEFFERVHAVERNPDCRHYDRRHGSH